ncbi:transmembrane protein 132E isoform X2 [Plodia interpunctella]|uniref:transmembrane protein 132E isoform X2 n=1 Tax=Plodia interpunctella TaxID=58824 RepID=UPI002367A36C|nr:transmembrane protein 132E isoform X2 [Plodia interpunctella]
MRRLILLLLTGTVLAVEVHFENKDSGFFLKHTARWSSAGPPPEPTSTALPGALLSLDRFTVLQGSAPASVRATYGPFSTKQTVPARYAVPDPLEPPRRNATLLELQDATAHRLDVSAHLVFKELPRDSPVLRVLFHTGGEGGARRAAARPRRVCITLHAMLDSRSLSATCGPEGEEGACLAELTIPAAWWPADGKGKRPPRTVKLTYSAAEAGNGDSGDGACGRVSVQPAWPLGSVTLAGARAGYREAVAGDAALLLPRAPLYPHSRIHLPFVVRRDASHNIGHIVIRMKVKSGLRLVSVTASNSRWAVTAEVKPRAATVTATRLEQPLRDDDGLDTEMEESSGAGGPGWEEVLTWLVEVGAESEGDADGSEGESGRGTARLSWVVRVSPNAPSGSTTEGPPPEHRANTRLDIEKDDIQAVLPISKNWEVLNTAVLTGRQVSQAMKVLIVSQAGQVADVTLQSSCHSEDESVLKVSSSCSSVYVDGSEIRGSSNASVIVKYGTYTGLARFTVWMPESPLEIDVDDNRLSQIKGWKVSDDSSIKERLKRSLSARGWGGTRPDGTNSLTDQRTCRLRYQQSNVEVYARFLAKDHDSGRVSYFVSRRTWLKVTELVLSLMRVSDPRIASLRGRVLQGRSTGRTEVQVLSPVTGRVIGVREIRVVNDKVSISRLLVRVISGLQLNISPDAAGIENGYVSETTVTRRLTAQYQEGLLDIDIEFSDGGRTALRDVAVSDYYLLVESLDPEVVAFAPMLASRHPRVIAVGEGSGELLRVTLLTPEQCRSGPLRRVALPGKGDMKTPANIKNIPGALASAAASVDVDFSGGDVPQRPDTPQNDDIMIRGGLRSGLAEFGEMIKGHSSMKDENNREPIVQPQQYGSIFRNSPPHRAPPPHVTPVEIGMYVLLGAFCFAIVVFVVSCVVYASRLKPATSGGPRPALAEDGRLPAPALGPRGRPADSTTNAHDWVWLGRATIERNGNRHPANRTSTQPTDNANSTEMRITANPLNYNYADPDDAIRENGNVMVTSFDNPNSIELPSLNDKKVIDSTTYCKKSARHNRSHSGDAHWQAPAADADDYRPPVPPHRNSSTPQPQLPVPPRNSKMLPEAVMPPSRRHSRGHKRHDHDRRDPDHRRPDRIIDLNKADAPYISSRDTKRDSNPLPPELDHAVEKLNHSDCSRLFEFDNDAPLVLDNKDYREIVGLNRGTDDSRRTFAKPQSPDYMHDSGIGLPEVQMRHKRTKEPKGDFVEASNSTKGWLPCSCVGGGEARDGGGHRAVRAPRRPAHGLRPDHALLPQPQGIKRLSRADHCKDPADIVYV